MRIFTKGAIASSISSAAFDPADITGYELDLLASSLDGTYNDGDEATSWPDETGTYTYTVGDGSPTFKTSILNGESIVRYAGSASDRHQETSPTIAWGQKYSFVYVIKETTGTGNSVQIARDQSNSPWVAFVNSSDDIHVAISYRIRCRTQSPMCRPMGGTGRSLYLSSGAFTNLRSAG